MKKYRWGIIGAGQIARKFAEDLNLLPNAELQAVASRSASRAKAFAGEHRIPRHYDNWKAMSRDTDVDIVYIATHHPYHYENALHCLKAGKAVLCEKPFTMNRQELEILVETARKKKVFLMEAIWTRFLPSVKKLLDIQGEGKLGRLVQVNADFGFFREFDPGHRLFDPELGGGALMDIGIYPVFIASLLAGKPLHLMARADFAPTGIDHCCQMILQHDNGVNALLNCGFLADLPTEAAIVFERGWIRMESPWHTPGPITLHQKGHDPRTMHFDEPGNGYIHEAKEVMHCLDEGCMESPSLPLDFSLDLMETLDWIRRECRITYTQDQLYKRP